MKDDKHKSTAQAELDVLQVLQAERDAEQTIRDCESRAQQVINDVQNNVERINVRADQRITNMEMRHSYKLNQIIRGIEREGAAELGHDAGRQYNWERLQTVIEKLATELCLGSTKPDDADAGK